MTSRTSSLSGVSLAALFDEIEKLAADESKTKSRLKRIAKVGLTAGAGSLAGYGAGVLVDRAAQKMMGERYKKWPVGTRMKVVLPLLGLSMVGWHAAQEYANEARRKEYARE